MDVNSQSNLQEYKDLQKEILEYETNWEDSALHPHANKSDKRIKKIEEVKYNEDIVDTTIDVHVSKIRKNQEHTQTEIANVLKDPITIGTFPLHVVKSVKVVSENPSYRVVKAYNCPVELRLSKLSVGNNAVFKPGDKIEVF
jgi:hypothetical protein